MLIAETIWRIAQIAEQGPAWFRSYGTPQEPGPRLVTIHGAVTGKGVIETEVGTPVAELLDLAGGVEPVDHQPLAPAYDRASPPTRLLRSSCVASNAAFVPVGAGSGTDQ